MMPIPRSLIACVLLLAGCAGQPIKHESTSVQSGLPIGGDVVPWNPLHVAGPDKGTNACPICTYEARPAVQIFLKDGPQVSEFASKLQKLVNQQHKREFKGFIIVTDGKPEPLKQLAADSKISSIGLCYPDPQTRAADLLHYNINPAAANTILIYKDYKIVVNFVDLDPTDFAKIEAVVDRLP